MGGVGSVGWDVGEAGIGCIQVLDVLGQPSVHHNYACMHKPAYVPKYVYEPKYIYIHTLHTQLESTILPSLVELTSKQFLQYIIATAVQ